MCCRDKILKTFSSYQFFVNGNPKGAVMQIEKALINDDVSKVSWKFCSPAVYNFGVIYPWNLLFSWKVTYFLTASIPFYVYKKDFTVR